MNCTVDYSVMGPVVDTCGLSMQVIGLVAFGLVWVAVAILACIPTGKKSEDCSSVSDNDILDVPRPGLDLIQKYDHMGQIKAGADEGALSGSDSEPRPGFDSMFAYDEMGEFGANSISHDSTSNSGSHSDTGMFYD